MLEKPSPGTLASTALLFLMLSSSAGLVGCGATTPRAESNARVLAMAASGSEIDRALSAQAVEGPGRHPGSERAGVRLGNYVELPQDRTEGLADPATGDVDLVSTREAPPAQKRRIIYEGIFEVLTPSPRESIRRFQVAVEEKGGYLKMRQDARVVARVPVEHFEEVVSLVAELGRVVSESVEARDVTREYLDLQIRLSTAEAALARLTELLKGANLMDDVLAIEKEIQRLTEKVERMKGQLRYLADQVSFSTLTVTFRSNAPSVKPPPGRTASRFPWINRVGIERILGGF